MRGHLNKLLCTVAAVFLAASFAHAAEDVPFAITIDGEQVDSSVAATDIATVSEADIQVKFDGLSVHPMLNVSTFPIRVNFKAGETIRWSPIGIG